MAPFNSWVSVIPKATQADCARRYLCVTDIVTERLRDGKDSILSTFDFVGNLRVQRRIDFCTKLYNEYWLTVLSMLLK